MSDLSLLSFLATYVHRKLLYFSSRASRDREGKYENSQEVFNSVRTVYQGLQLTYVFSLILSLLSFPSDLRYSKQGLCLKSVPKGRHLAQQRVLAAPVS